MKTISCTPHQSCATTADAHTDDFNSMDETEYLLGNPANAKHLRDSIADLKAGRGIEVKLEDL